MISIKNVTLPNKPISNFDLEDAAGKLKIPYFKGVFLLEGGKPAYPSGVRGREVERRPRNLEVPSSIPGSGCQLWDFFIGPHIRREYWCSSQEAESREISISC